MAAGGSAFAHVGGKFLSFFEKSGDHFRFRHSFHQFATAEDDTFSLAGGDSQVGRLSLTDAVDDASENADGHRRELSLIQFDLHLFDDPFQVDLESATCGAGDQFRLANASAGRLQDVEGGLDFWDGVAQQADANGVADPRQQDGSQPARALDDRVRGLARFGQAYVRGVVCLLGIELVGLGHGARVAGFQRDDDLTVAKRFGGLDVAKGAFDQGRGRWVAVLFEQIFFEASAVNPDAHRDSLVACSDDDLFESIFAADVTWVDSNLVDAVIDAAEGHPVIEVDVADYRNRGSLSNGGDRLEVFFFGDGDADEFATGVGKSMDLGDGGVDVGCFGSGHRLNPNGVFAAEDLVSHFHFAGLVSTKSWVKHSQGKGPFPGWKAMVERTSPVSILPNSM